MGNYDIGAVGGKQGAVFRQSPHDFPCPVALGKNTPSFGLYRFNKALRFVPPGGEGFALRGDGRRLLYKGRRRSHRFTILGDTAFEYDCILEREPDGNVISLMMEGAENYDFFRQPVFVKEPFLKGSYAVYKKETLPGEGTGKLCHIHRPQITDAKGRRCWGELSVAGNELRITIPEKWLGEAKYPVIVDPTIGTATVGSQYIIHDYGEDMPLNFEASIAANRFYIPETLNGLCTAYIYASDDVHEYGEAGGMPVLFSDNNNNPYSKLSVQENFINFDVNAENPKGWRSGNFRSNGSIGGGMYIWFGVASQYFWWPRFDYGSRAVMGDWDAWDSLPDIFPNRMYWEDNFKLSMYFTYVGAQNYVRTITQGVRLSDSRKLKADYKRSLLQTAGVNSLLGRYKTLFLKLQETVKGIDGIFSPVLFLRSLRERVTTTETVRHIGAYVRGLSDNAENTTEVTGGWILLSKIADTVRAAGYAFRGLTLFVRIVSGVYLRDYLFGRFLKARGELVLKSVVSREITLESKII